MRYFLNLGVEGLRAVGGCMGHKVPGNVWHINSIMMILQ